MDLPVKQPVALGYGAAHAAKAAAVVAALPLSLLSAHLMQSHSISDET